MQSNLKNSGVKVLKWIFAALIFWPAFHSISSGNDFDIFIRAAYALHDSGELYTKPFVNGLYYYYSPFFAMLLQPFVFLREWHFPKESMLPGISYALVAVKIIWSTLTILMIVRIIKIVANVFRMEPSRKRNIFWIILLLLCYRWFWMNLWYGQLTIFLLWVILESFLGKLQKGWYSGLLMGLGINVKVLPLFFMGKYGLDLNFKAILNVLIWLMVFILIPFVFYDFDYISQQTLSWLNTINPLQQKHVITVGEGGFVDVGALVVKYFTSYKIPTEPTVCITELSHNAIFIITQILRLLLIGMVAFLYLKIKKSRGIHHANFLSIAVFCASIPLIFPHQRDYSFALLIPSVVYMVYTFMDNKYLMHPIMSGLTFVSLIMLGSVIFFEFFSLEFRYWMLGVRLQGLGGLLYFICFSVFVFDYTKKVKLESVN